MAAASVTRTISSASSFSIVLRGAGCSVTDIRASVTGTRGSGRRLSALLAEVAAAGEDHRQVVAVGDLDRHLVADRAAGLDDRRHAGLRGELDAVREREIGVADAMTASFARSPARRSAISTDTCRLA